jgi:hypothetical protein
VVNRSRGNQGWQILLLLLVLGGVAGAYIGYAALKWWPVLAPLDKGLRIGLPAFTLNLHVFSLTFGFMFNINFFTLVGFIVAWLFYKRL